MDHTTWADTVERVGQCARESLSPTRLAHVERVALLTQQLCRRFAVSEEKGLCAAWAHDLAREWPQEQLLTWSARDGYPLDDLERRHPVLLHGRVAARLLSERFEVRDQAVLSAVRHHTLGHPGMGTLARVLFVADYFEPGRSFLTPRTRSVVTGSNLDRMVCEAIEDVSRRGLALAPVTEELYREVQPRNNRHEEGTGAS